MANLRKITLEKQKKEQESFEVTIPSYYEGFKGGIMVTEDSIIAVYKDSIVTQPLNYENFDLYCGNRNLTDLETFLKYFNKTISFLIEKTTPPTIFDELKNDEEYFSEPEMSSREEEYCYQQENSNTYEQ